MTKKYILGVLLAVGFILVILFYWYSQEEKDISLVPQNTSVSESANNINPPEQTIPTNTNISDTTRKSEADVAEGKLVNYKNQDFGISFTYNQEAYTSPVVFTEGNSYQDYQQQSQILMRDNTFIGEVATATGSVRIHKEDRPEGYLSTEVKNIKSYEYCKILNQDLVDGQAAVRYQCSELGDGETVLFQHPKGYFIRIHGTFTSKYYDEIIKSITLLI